MYTCKHNDIAQLQSEQYLAILLTIKPQFAIRRQPHTLECYGERRCLYHYDVALCSHNILDLCSSPRIRLIIEHSAQVICCHFWNQLPSWTQLAFHKRSAKVCKQNKTCKSSSTMNQHQRNRHLYWTKIQTLPGLLHQELRIRLQE